MDDRIQIEETIAQFGLLVDARDWHKLEALFTANVDVDYTSLFGGSAEKITSKDLVTRWTKLLTPLKATQHMITNLHIAFKENGDVECAGNVQATHVKRNSMGDANWVVGGRYDFKLKKEGQTGKISAVKLTTQWTTGNPQILTT